MAGLLSIAVGERQLFNRVTSPSELSSSNVPTSANWRKWLGDKLELLLDERCAI